MKKQYLFNLAISIGILLSLAITNKAPAQQLTSLQNQFLDGAIAFNDSLLVNFVSQPMDDNYEIYFASYYRPYLQVWNPQSTTSGSYVFHFDPAQRTIWLDNNSQDQLNIDTDPPDNYGYYLLKNENNIGLLVKFKTKNAALIPTTLTSESIVVKPIIDPHEHSNMAICLIATIDTLRNIDRNTQEQYETFSTGIYNMHIGHKGMIDNNLSLIEVGNNGSTYSPNEVSFQKYVDGVRGISKVFDYSVTITTNQWPQAVFEEVAGNVTDNLIVEIGLNIFNIGGYLLNQLLDYFIVPFVDIIGNASDNLAYLNSGLVYDVVGYLQPGYIRNGTIISATPSDYTQNNITLKHFKNIDFYPLSFDNEFEYYTNSTFTTRFGSMQDQWHDRSFYGDEWNMFSIILDKTDAPFLGYKFIAHFHITDQQGRFIAKDILTSQVLEIPWGFGLSNLVKMKRFDFYFYILQSLLDEDCLIQVELFDRFDQVLQLSWSTSTTIGGAQSDPLLSSPDVFPSSGSSQTPFRFQVNYTNPYNIAPDNNRIELLVDGNHEDWLYSDDNTYNDGAQFYKNEISISGSGNHSVQYRCYVDGDLIGPYPSTGMTLNISAPIIDTLPPVITNYAPNDNATNVDRYDAVEIDFNEDINLGTISTNTVVVGAYGTYSLDYNQSNDVLEINIPGGFDSEDVVTVWVTDDVEDLAGNKVQNYPNWSFTVEDYLAPEAPTNLVGQGADQSIFLVWSPNAESDLEGYNIYRKTASTNYVRLNTNLLTSPDYTDNTIENFKHYNYYITAVDDAGNESTMSNFIDVFGRVSDQIVTLPTGTYHDVYSLAEGNTYLINGTITIPESSNLRIEQNVVVKFSNGYNSKLIINGNIELLSSFQNEIVFTSINDNSIGGATGTGTPSPAGWGYIYLNNPDLVFHDAIVKYGGYKANDNGTFYDGSVIVNSADSIFNVFFHNNYYPLGLWNDGIGVEMDSLSFSGNTNHFIKLSGNLTDSVNLVDLNIPYCTKYQYASYNKSGGIPNYGQVYINSNGNLSIAKGSRLEIQGGSFLVQSGGSFYYPDSTTLKALSSTFLVQNGGECAFQNADTLLFESALLNVESGGYANIHDDNLLLMKSGSDITVDGTMDVGNHVITKLLRNGGNTAVVNISGELNFNFFSSEKLVFTSYNDTTYAPEFGNGTPQPADWGYIYLNNPDLVFHDAIVKYGGYKANDNGTFYDGSVIVNSADSIFNVFFHNNYYPLGLWNDGIGVEMDSLSFSGNTNHFIKLSGNLTDSVNLVDLNIPYCTKYQYASYNKSGGIPNYGQVYINSNGNLSIAKGSRLEIQGGSFLVQSGGSFYYPDSTTLKALSSTFLVQNGGECAFQNADTLLFESALLNVESGGYANIHDDNLLLMKSGSDITVDGTMDVGNHVITKLLRNGGNTAVVNISGELNFNFFSSEKLVFTSYNDTTYAPEFGNGTPQPADWGYIYLNNPDLVFHDAIVKYGGYKANDNGTFYDGSVIVNSADSIFNVFFHNNYYPLGLWNDGIGVEMDSLSFSGNTNHFIKLSGNLTDSVNLVDLNIPYCTKYQYASYNKSGGIPNYGQVYINSNGNLSIAKGSRLEIQGGSFLVQSGGSFYYPDSTTLKALSSTFLVQNGGECAFQNADTLLFESALLNVESGGYANIHDDNLLLMKSGSDITVDGTMDVGNHVITKLLRNGGNTAVVNISGELNFNFFSSEKLVFTSYNDTTYAPEFGNGTPQPADWGYIYLNNPDLVFHDAIVKYGGYKANDNGTFYDGSVIVNSADSIFNVFFHNNYYPLGLWNDGIGVEMDSLSFSGNTNHFIKLSGNLTDSVNLVDLNIPYCTKYQYASYNKSGGIPNYGQVYINSNGNLSIAKGSRLEIQGGSFLVQSGGSFYYPDSTTLKALSSTFLVQNGGECAFQNADTLLFESALLNVESGGYANIHDDNLLLMKSGSDITVDGTMDVGQGVITKLLRSGSNLANANFNGQVNISSSVNNPIVFTSFNDTTDSPVYGNGNPQPADWGYIYLSGNYNLQYININYATTGIDINGNINMSNCIVSRNTIGLEVRNNQSLSISNSDIFQNNLAIHNSSSNEVMAVSNYWGSDTGPYHVTNNPSGEGNPVSNNVSFTPWLMGPVNYEGVAPLPFNLNYPVNGSLIPAPNINFNWSEAIDNDPDDKVNYIIEWSLDLNFTTLLASDTVDTTSYLLQGLPRYNQQLNAYFPDEDTIYWRVDAYDLFNLHRLSTPSQSSIYLNIPESPEPFSLISPTIIDTVLQDTARLFWHQAIDLDAGSSLSYEVWLDNNENLSTAILVASSLSDTSFLINGLNNGQKYYWTVKATDNNTAGTWATDTLEFLVDIPHTFHYSRVWEGGPYLPMNIIVTSAFIENDSLTFGDEIAIYDIDDSGNEICVGVEFISVPIAANNPLLIVVSSDDPTTTDVDGFINGHSILYRIWDIETNTEYENVLANYPIPGFDTVFSAMGTAFVEIEGISSYTQSINLNLNWNIISFNVLPDDNNLLNILQPLADSGLLIKVIDESGSFIQNLPEIGWMNTIGDMMLTEGYYIKVPEQTNISTLGLRPETPFSIPLQLGWNMIGYPLQNSQNSTTAIQELVNSSHLIKIIDESGGFIQYIPTIGWINTIGDFEPGEGYYIKLNSNDTLTLNESSSSKNSTLENWIHEGINYERCTKGNPYLPMHIIAHFPENIPLQEGDELGIYINDLCVGSSYIIDPLLPVVTFLTTDDPTTTTIKDGGAQGDVIQFRLLHLGEEYDLQIANNSMVTFESLETKLVNFTTNILEISESSSSEIKVGEVIPNPFSSDAKIRVTTPESGTLKVSIIDQRGIIVEKLFEGVAEKGDIEVVIDGKDLKPGLYFVKVEYENYKLKREVLKKVIMY